LARPRRPVTTTAVAPTVAATLGLFWPASSYAAALNLNPDPVLVGGWVVLFLLLIYPVNRLFLRPLTQVLERREESTLGAVAEAEELLAQASRLQDELEQGLRGARERARARQAELAAETQEQERHVLERAREDASRTVDAVRDTVAEELDAARAAMRTDATALAREAAEKILGRAL
jgi:F-type H+-transporting ATPase subunit b